MHQMWCEQYHRGTTLQHTDMPMCPSYILGVSVPLYRVCLLEFMIQEERGWRYGTLEELVWTDAHTDDQLHANLMF